ncbi:MAG: hypothetical protein JOY55_23540 [Mycobacterium sp.]|nr:hypothetical protein [Mycobacterium sp.]MBV8294736.1 hypothetical protein [Mycobacterium sp.]
MKRTGNNDVTLIRDKGRGLSHPEKISLRRHAAPTCHLPVVDRSKEAECIEALDRLNVPLNSSRDDARNILRVNNYKFRNDVLGAALKARRSSAHDGTTDLGDG